MKLDRICSKQSISAHTLRPPEVTEQRFDLQIAKLDLRQESSEAKNGIICSAQL